MDYKELISLSLGSMQSQLQVHLNPDFYSFLIPSFNVSIVSPLSFISYRLGFQRKCSVHFYFWQPQWFLRCFSFALPSLILHFKYAISKFFIKFSLHHFFLQHSVSHLDYIQFHKDCKNILHRLGKLMFLIIITACTLSVPFQISSNFHKFHCKSGLLNLYSLLSTLRFFSYW
jgi:hypothetical protein